MSKTERIAAAAYAEYCYRVYSSDAKWADWNALPAYLRRAWVGAIEAAVNASKTSNSKSVTDVHR